MEVVDTGPTCALWLGACRALSYRHITRNHKVLIGTWFIVSYWYIRVRKLLVFIWLHCKMMSIMLTSSLCHYVEHLVCLLTISFLPPFSRFSLFPPLYSLFPYPFSSCKSKKEAIPGLRSRCLSKRGSPWWQNVFASIIPTIESSVHEHSWNRQNVKMRFFLLMTPSDGMILGSNRGFDRAWSLVFKIHLKFYGVDIMPNTRPHDRSYVALANYDRPSFIYIPSMLFSACLSYRLVFVDLSHIFYVSGL